MPVTLTDLERAALRDALLAYKAKTDELKNLETLVAVKQVQVQTVFESVLAVATIQGTTIEMFRWGTTTYRIGPTGVHEVETILDLTP